MAECEWTYEACAKWIQERTWYQQIELSNGLRTPGWVDCGKRLPLLRDAEIQGRTLLDIGCNSGYYCLWAKRQGARRVVGVDSDPVRIEEANTLAKMEGLDIEFTTGLMSELGGLGRFDTVLCFAVLTEIPDLLGSLGVLKNVIGGRAFIELALAKPVLYLSRSASWWKSLFKREYSRGMLEIRPSKKGWMLSPSLEVARRVFGPEFTVSFLGRGLRYDMICVQRIS
ncbi:MAG: class I SAM-dependent methyltransferase [Planctomycetes bacterium]|nr:class I SAM-dependent methyltransferase [Planctomycetota bacterium]